MLSFLLWLILLVIAWPLALVALLLYPVVWLITRVFRLVGITANSALDLVGAILSLPGRVLRGPKAFKR